MLKGKKTYLGAIALGLLSVVFGIDQWADGSADWMPYEVITGLLASWTGVSMRMAVTKNS